MFDYSSYRFGHAPFVKSGPIPKILRLTVFDIIR